jgi:cytoskeletal protein CcmA (bactofilin family)
MTEVRGDCDAENVSVNGKLSVSGSLSVSGILDAVGSAEVNGDVKGGILRLGGRLRARKVAMSSEANLAGEIETELGMRAKSITVGSGSKCRGPMVGERIELGRSSLALTNWSGTWAGQIIAIRAVGRMTDVEDLYADEVVLGKNTRCRRVFAEKVEVAEGCVLDQVVYTSELRGPVVRAEEGANESRRGRGWTSTRQSSRS